MNPAVVGVTMNLSSGPRARCRCSVDGALLVEKYPHDSRANDISGVSRSPFFLNHFIHTNMPTPTRQQTPATVPAVTAPVGLIPLPFSSSSLSSGVVDSVVEVVGSAEAEGGWKTLSGTSDVSTDRISEVDEDVVVDVGAEVVADVYSGTGSKKA